MPALRGGLYAERVEVEPFDERPDRPDEGDRSAARSVPAERPRGAAAWWQRTNHNPGVIAFIRRARRALPGDPDFGDPLSAAGDGGPRAAARAADRLLRDRKAASREVSLAALQVWQALTERVSGRLANPEVTLVFTDLVGFSTWSLQAGDGATLKLLRRVAQAVESPLLDAGGHIVKRMGDGIMAVFADPTTAVRATIAAREAVKSVEVDGYTPRMRAGVHTGRPQRIGADWLGVDVNIAARVMERATRGGLVVSETTLERIPADDLESLGVTVKRLRRQVFSSRSHGVPADLTMYRLKTRRELPGDEEPDEEQPQA
jgi:class 3 adenylate cyclase